jgi:choline kinase
MTTRHAVILAAGFGSRLNAQEGHKLLAQIGGRALLDYHLDAFARVGVTRVSIVTGFKHDDLEAAVAAQTASRDLDVRTAHNPDFEGSNGLSVLAALRDLSPDDALPFWLTMADHLFDPTLFDALAAAGGADALPEGTQGALWVDHKLDTIYDMPDATKVDLGPGDTLRDIGKEIPSFNAVDVGLFWCHQGFVDALVAERDARGDCSTSDAVRRLSAQSTFAFPDVGPALWQDVDTPGARAHAEKLVARWAR